MAAPTGAHATFPARPYNSNLARPQQQYTSAYGNTPFQQTQQSYAPASNTQQQQTQPRAMTQAERERADQTALDSITEEQREEVNEAFALFDLDKDGYIDYHETKVAFKALGFELPKSEIVNLLQSYGVTNQQGAKNQQPTFMGPNRLLLPLSVFQAEAARRISARDPEEEILRAFELFDQDGKGRIDLNDLRRVARELGEGLGEEELRAMIEEFDVRGEGGINREEFIGICMG